MVGVSWLKIVERAAEFANFTQTAAAVPTEAAQFSPTDSARPIKTWVGASIPQHALAPMQIVQV